MNAPARNAYAAYQKHEVEGLNPAEIIHRLYQKLHSKLQGAREAIKKGQAGPKGENLSRALAIIGELQASLNLEQGGEIADNLNGIYSFLIMELAMIGLHNDADRLAKVIRIVEPLLDAWEQVSKSGNSQVKGEALPSEAIRQEPFHAILG
jgi:flagellar secretion chaperone FliS